MEFSGRRHACAIGRAGISVRKREGDGATPAGCWAFRRVCYRPDRVARPHTMLPVRPLHVSDGWCDDPTDRNYNRPVRLPYPARAEMLWRDDELYDVLVILGYNDVSRARALGSAIFMHVASKGLSATDGCVALPRHQLLVLLKQCSRASRIQIIG